MDPLRIEDLLDRYFEGMTSLEEERRLRRFFQQADLPDHLVPYQPFFRELDAAAEESPGEDFDARLTERLQQSRPHLSAHHPWGARLARVAALLLLALGAWWLVPRPTGPQPQAQAIDWSRYEPESPEEALRITLQALNRTSSKFKEGTTATRNLKKLKAINQVTATN